MEIKKKFSNVMAMIGNTDTLSSLRRGLIIVLPVILISNISLVFTSFPSESYQEFIQTVCDGKIFYFLNLLTALISNYIILMLIISISISYARNKKYMMFFPITNLCSYIIFTIDLNNTDNLEIFQPTWLFTALVVTYLSSFMLNFFINVLSKKEKYVYSDGADSTFNTVLNTIIPMICVLFIFALMRLISNIVLSGTNFNNFGAAVCDNLFEIIGGGFKGGFLFILLTHLFWFFGIHGNNMLEAVALSLFESGMQTNTELVNAGLMPTEIYTKTFMDVFVLMGGCGTSFCIILALFIAGKRANDRKLAKISIVPILFNISELVVYGLPIFFNPIMFIPFIATPLIMFSISSAAVNLGLVPIASHTVKWTTPILFSGYLATGSISGTILQIVCLAVGTLIYIPFIKIMEKNQTELVQKNINLLIDKVKEAEAAGVSPNLFESDDKTARNAKSLAKDLRHAVEVGDAKLFYQPQVGYDSKVLGGEALLRWNHPIAGFIYPPLLVELAIEDDFMNELGFYIIETGCRDLEEYSKIVAYPIKISVNISPKQLDDPEFSNRVKEILDKYDFGKNKLVFEVTEQISLSANSLMNTRILELRKMGIEFSLDDFGMGHSSMMYLQENDFSYVKLDGSLIRNVLKNEKSVVIISSIVEFSKKIDFIIIAEYVETEEQREFLHELGCDCYQGYLYGKAEEKAKFIEFLERNGAIKKK